MLPPTDFVACFVAYFVLGPRSCQCWRTLAHRSWSSELQTTSDHRAGDPLARFRDRLSQPLIAAPMFLVSGVDLGVRACTNGVTGAFRTGNCSGRRQLD